MLCGGSLNEKGIFKSPVLPWCLVVHARNDLNCFALCHTEECHSLLFCKPYFPFLDFNHSQWFLDVLLLEGNTKEETKTK